MASIYRRGKIWWVKFHLKGIRVQQSLNTTHERVAQARKSRIEYRLATGTLVMPSETPIADFLEGFCQYLRGTRTRKSYKNDISYLRVFFGPVCPSLKPGNTCNRDKVLRKDRPKVQEACKNQHVCIGLLECEGRSKSAALREAFCENGWLLTALEAVLITRVSAERKGSVLQHGTVVGHS